MKLKYLIVNLSLLQATRLTCVSHCLKKQANMSIDIGGMRIPYKSPSDVFLESNLSHKEPIGQFGLWFEEAKATPTIAEANAMCLATATRNGVPSCRMLLLKGYGKDGFKFFTNYNSRKAQELEENPNASLCFYWEPLKRSVRVEGAVQRIPEEDSAKYFHSRPRESQIAAIVSNQSKVISSRQSLSDRNEALNEKYADETIDIPKPNHWGGYLLVPKVIEFWQGQSNRLHDRIRFRRKEESESNTDTHEGEDGWVYERLDP